MPNSLYHPRYWVSWLTVVLIRIIAVLPVKILIKLGKPLGTLLYWLVVRRRKVVMSNLERCFPEKSTVEITKLALSHFQALGMMVMEMIIAWWKPIQSVPAKLDIKGLAHLEDALAENKGVLLLSAHFTSLEIGGALLQRETGHVIHGMYRPHENPVFEAVVKKKRQRGFEQMIPRDNVKQMLRSLKQGVIVWYAPDQAYRGRNSIEVPFFNQPAATNPGTSRIAKLSGAPVIPYFPIRKSNGLDYELRLLPPLDNFPSDDPYEDTLKTNQLIESIAREHPEQYYWVHRRFKYTRPSD